MFVRNLNDHKSQSLTKNKIMKDSEFEVQAKKLLLMSYKGIEKRKSLQFRKHEPKRSNVFELNPVNAKLSPIPRSNILKEEPSTKPQTGGRFSAFSNYLFEDPISQKKDMNLAHNKFIEDRNKHYKETSMIHPRRKRFMTFHDNKEGECNTFTKEYGFASNPITPIKPKPQEGINGFIELSKMNFCERPIMKFNHLMKNSVLNNKCKSSFSNIKRKKKKAVNKKKSKKVKLNMDLIDFD